MTEKKAPCQRDIAAEVEANKEFMWHKETMKPLLHWRYWTSWLSLLVLGFFAWLPNRLRDAVAVLLAFPLSFLSIKPKRVMMRNLQAAFPEYDAKKRQSVYRKFLTQLLITFMSYGEPFFLPKWMLARRWKVKNPEVLEKARAAGRPFIFVVPHVLNMDRCGLWLSYVGIPMLCFVKSQRNKVHDWFINHQRLTFGGLVAERNSNGMMTAIRGLRKGYSTFILFDEDLGGEYADFIPMFNMPKATVNSLPRMAKMTKAQVVFLDSCYNMRTANYELRFELAEDYPSTDLTADLTRMNAFYEDQMRRHVEQYMWFLHVFKTVPDRRYFEDIYNFQKEDSAIDFEHRHIPFTKEQYVDEDYVPLVDYRPIVQAQQEAKAAEDQQAK